MNLLQLGVEPYDAVHALQLALVDARHEERIGDTLLLLEHEPTFTLGRRGDAGNIVAEDATLHREGIVVRRVERGGDVTYHGPGQLVGYPIIHLPSRGLGASDYMHTLEDVLIDVVEGFGVRTHRRDGIIGVWVGANKIAALGVRIRRGVTFHGFALNVAPNMTHWSYIIACGITDGGITSLAREVDRVHPGQSAPDMATVRRHVCAAMMRRFGDTLLPTRMEELGIAVLGERQPTKT